MFDPNAVARINRAFDPGQALIRVTGTANAQIS
jgi:hypothetical protein